MEHSGKFYEVWSTGLTANPSARISTFALNGCIDATNEAIGKLESDIKQCYRDKQGNVKGTSQKLCSDSLEVLVTHGGKNKLYRSVANWKAIENELDINKISFGRKIKFVSDSYKKEIIFRDIEQSFILASVGYSKPAVILAGSVIEELLRLYLEHRNISPKADNFDGYIKACEENKLLKSGISRLSDSVRHFRNLVHLSKELSKRYTISKATAKGAVSSIFTVANDF